MAGAVAEGQVASEARVVEAVSEAAAPPNCSRQRSHYYHSHTYFCHSNFYPFGLATSRRSCSLLCLCTGRDTPRDWLAELNRCPSHCSLPKSPQENMAVMA